MTSPDSPFSTLLSRHAHALHTTVTELVKDFYFTLDQDSIAAEILAQLGTDERLHLHATQAEHLRLLLHPELDRDTHRQAALRGGRAHAIIGVSASSLVRAMGLYLQTISSAILRLAAPLEERSALLHVIGQRLQQNLQWQIESLDHFQAELDDTEQRVTTICQAGQPWADTIRSILDAVLCIPGITGSAFLRHDRQGHLVAEFFAGSYEAFWQKIHSADGAAAKRAMEIRFEKAWQTAIPEAIPNFVSQKHAELRAVAMAVKVRSATILPLCPKSDKTVALLCLTGNYPFTFNSSAVTRFLTSMTMQLNTTLRREPASRTEEGISATQRRYYRELLQTGGLEMFYQPIIDLHSGALIKVEALARLRLPNGDLLSPARFLPWLGMEELTDLFHRGLRQALAQIRRWDQDNLSLDLNVNLPPEILVQPECPHWVDAALQDQQLPPHRLHLELLENDSPQEPRLRDQAIAALAHIGVRLEMDDLGSGHSSLLRLRTMPFSGIKIDQGLMRGCLEGSRKAPGIVAAITTLGKDMGLSVVIEGLENPGLMEVAAILGAHRGQGYAISRPLPAGDLPAWQRDWRWDIDPEYPRTLLGTWAQFWRWQREYRFSNAASGQKVRYGVGRYIQDQNLQGSPLAQAHQRMHHALVHADTAAGHHAIQNLEKILVAQIADMRNNKTLNYFLLASNWNDCRSQSTVPQPPNV